MCDHDDFWDLWDDYEACSEDHYDEGYEDGYEHGRRTSYRPQPQRNEGCYLATAVYGSYDCPEVWTFRRFRDLFLKKYILGRWFVRFYYAVSPTLAAWTSERQFLTKHIRKLLNSFASKLNRKGYANTPYTDA